MTVDGEKVTVTDGKLTLSPSEKPQTVVATNISGKSAAVTVKVNDGHTYGEWTKADDKTESRVCSVCGAVESRAITDDKTKPSEDQDKNSDKGKADGNSGKTDKDGNNADKAGSSKDSDVPKTGDESNLLLWLALFAASGGTGTVIVIAGRRRKYRG